MKKWGAVLLFLACRLFVSMGTAEATPITFDSGLVNNSLSATALFDVVNGQLEVVLTNTGGNATMSNGTLLTGVFFNIGAGTMSLSYASGVAESLIRHDGTSYAGALSVGTNWALAYNGGNALGGSAAPYVTQAYGFVGAGFGLASSGMNTLDGPNYGIVTAGFAGAGNLNHKKDPYIKNSITLLAGGNPASFDPSASISDVRFQWGTALNEPSGSGSPAPVPEPSTLLLLGSGVAGLVGYGRKRFRTTS